MILFLGSSSLIKLYAAEARSREIVDWVRVAEIVATCRIAYTEVISALRIRRDKGDLSDRDYDTVTEQFSKDWQGFVKIDFDDVEAGHLVRKYGVTRFGALHLSAAKLMLKEQERLSLTGSAMNNGFSRTVLFFLSEDESLCRAAAEEGLKILPVV